MTENKRLTAPKTPEHAAWEAAVLPLNYSRLTTIAIVYCVDSMGRVAIVANPRYRLWVEFTTP